MKSSAESLFDASRPLAERVAEAFAEDGPIARATPGFRPRPGQVEFALAVARAIEGKETLLAEAGTGTGKSFAYLVPAILSGAVVVISTAGKPLQDQLFQKDIPALSAAFGVNLPTAVLKGRSNYVCPHHLERTESEGMLPQRDSYRKLREIRRFAATSPTGDRAELPTVPEDDPLWPLVTSTRESCLGKDRCEHWEDCFVRAAREKAMKSQVIVVNHHLYLSSLALKNGAGGQIDGMLPAANLTVFDEAHQLPAIATDFFGTFFSTRQIEQIAAEARMLGVGHARDGADWDKLNGAASKAVYDFLIAARDLGLHEGDRRAVKTIEGFGGLAPEFSEVLRTFGDVVRALEANRGRSDELDTLLDYAREVDGEMAGWESIFKRLADSAKALGGPEPKDAKAASGAQTTDGRSEEKPPERPGVADSGDGFALKRQESSVQWISVASTSMRFNNTPLSFAGEFRDMREAEGGAWVFTSATLSAGGDFSHFCSETGINEPRTVSAESPFNYWEQGCFYLPKLPPPVNALEHAANVVEAAWPLVLAAGGRAFFLCTSLAAVARISEELEVRLEERGNPYPLLVQGQMPKAALVGEFRRRGNAILVGSMSFWEGVDGRGDALSLVVIDKLPFSPPDDPVFAARSEAIRRRGASPFGVQALPEAIISLKQGAGRLIRSETDRGVLMICDSRLAEKSYGRIVMRSLPDFFRTRSLEKARQFFEDPEGWARNLYQG